MKNKRRLISKVKGFWQPGYICTVSRREECKDSCSDKKSSNKEKLLLLLLKQFINNHKKPTKTVICK